jgi:DNA repair exonuclease SbcCD ATPase subunit
MSAEETQPQSKNLIKLILQLLVFLIIGVGGYFTLEQSRKFEELQKDRLATIAKNKSVTASAEAQEKELKTEEGILAQKETEKSELISKSEALASNIQMKERDVQTLDQELAAQKEKFDELERSMAEVRQILAGLGEEITIENLPEKIKQIEDDKKQRDAKLEELTTLLAAQEKQLETNRGELGRQVSKKVERDNRIARNAMESVITSVDQDWGFLVIGAGSNSGFTPQTSLVVERDGRFIGRVRPSSIEPTQTIAEIDFGSLAAGVRLQPGDRVLLGKTNKN